MVKIKPVVYCLMSQSQKIMYIGRTTQATRFSKHKSHYKRYQLDKDFCMWYSAFEVLACDDVEFHVIREYGNKKEVVEGEREIINLMRKSCFFKVVNKIC